MRKLITLLLIPVFWLSAAVVPVDRAQKVAENYYAQYAPESAKSNTVQKVLTKEYIGQPTWYVFQFTEGWVIVSADDAVRPILGYSFDGKITEDLSNMQNPFVNRFSYYDRQIVHNAREKGYVNTKAARDWKDIENNIFPKESKAIIMDRLVESEWDQSFPWNKQCPESCPTGGVAIAMAQIMRFFQGPDLGAGIHSYSDTTGSVTGSHSVDFSNSEYYWQIMQALTLNDITHYSQEDELAELCYNCAVSVDTDFETDISSALLSDVPYALESYFGFDNGAEYATIGTVTDPATWSANIRSNLDSYKPLIWGGSYLLDSYAFILDGYSDDYWYHFNWGWGGYYNGWFKLNDLTPAGYDFTSSQECVYNLYVAGFADEWPPPTNLQGSLANLDDVNLTWERPAGVKYGMLTGYNIFRSGVLIGSVSPSTITYDDYDLSSGTYRYTVKAAYTTPDGESFHSNTCEMNIVIDQNYPPPAAPYSQTQGRHSIDISWVTPFCGAIFFLSDFEYADLASEWHHERTVDYPPTGRKISGKIDNFTKADITDGWFSCDPSSFSGNGQTYIHSGNYSMAIDRTSPDHTWVLSPAFTISTSDAALQFWHWISGSSPDVKLTTTYVDLYTGDFTEINPSLYLTEIAAFTGIDETTRNLYDSLVTVDLSAFTGEYRIAWIYKYTDGYETAVDDIVIGSTNGGPAEYEVYRNGSYAATITETSWSDTGFADGLNEYYAKAVYPTGTSIASDRTSAYIYANPAPGFLNGILAANQQDVDLSWYAPLHLPPHWFGYIDDTFEDYFDNFYDMGLTGTWAERRTVFTASGLGTGYTYPFTVDSLAAAFYEGDNYWTSPNFTYEIWTTNQAGSADSTISISPTLTAVSGYYTTWMLDRQYTMKWGWYVSLHVNDDGTPSSLVNVLTDGTQSHSAVYYGGDGTYSPGWYNITFGGDYSDWAIICFGQGAEPTWYYNKNEQPEEKLTLAPNGILKGSVKPDLNATAENSKALVHYNIWRNGSNVGTTANTYFTDESVPAAPAEGHEYWVTAVYSDPSGESAPSESVYIYGGFPPPPPPYELFISSAGTNITLSWDAVAGATGYYIYSSSDPYGTYSLAGSATENSWTTPASESKKFYYITATDELKKPPPEKIFLQKNSR